MRLAILTDIHANKEAFSAVLADLADRAIDRIVLLGDIVGYGPDPEFCTDRAADLVAKGAIAVRGNHDDAVLRPDPTFSRNAKLALDWTRPRLSPAQAGFLGALPMQAALGDVLFVHAAPQDPENWVYLTSVPKAVGAFGATSARMIFCGHVHRPQLYAMDMGGTVQAIAHPVGKPLPLLRSRRWLAVVGAVGQPRDGNPMAAYAILDRGSGDLTFRRVPYDAARTATKLRQAGLPEALAARLLNGE